MCGYYFHVWGYYKKDFHVLVLFMALQFNINHVGITMELNNYVIIGWYVLLQFFK